MTEVQVLSLQTTVVLAIFGIAFALGVVMSRSNFCTMGALSDIVNMGDWTRMRMWLFAIATAIFGTAILSFTGTINLAASIYTGNKVLWLSNLIGGLLFGFGMVLASGCGSKTLIRLGAGSLKSLLVFIVMGLFAYMTLRGIFGVLRVNFLDPVALSLPGSQDVSSMIASAVGSATATARFAIAVVIAALIAIFCLLSKEFRSRQTLVSSLLIGLAIVVGWYISGALGNVEEDPRTLAQAYLSTNSGRMESFSFVAPAAYTLEILMFWSDKSRIVTYGIAATIGMIGGAALDAVLSRQFRWEGFTGAEDTANHIVGAALMGIGGVLAVGCTVGQGLSGLSTLALGSIISFVAILAGGKLGLNYQMWRVNSMV